MPVIESLQKCNKLRDRRQNHTYMKDLMRRPEQIVPSRIRRLGEPHGVEGGATDVQCALQRSPFETHLPVNVLQSPQLQTVNDREDRGQSHRDEHRGPEWSPGRSAELGR